MAAVDYIDSMRHGVVVFLGSGKTFKSGTMYSLLDYCPHLRGRRKAFYDFPIGLGGLFPSSMKAYEVHDVWDIEPDSIAVFEDANRLFGSRSSSRDTTIPEWLGVISHKDILVMLTVQNTANTDQAFFRDQDVVVVHKRMSPDGIRYERPEFQASCEWANVIIDDTARELGVDWHMISYVPRFGERLIVDGIVPDWYGERQSHALRDYRPVKDKGARP